MKTHLLVYGLSIALILMATVERVRGDVIGDTYGFAGTLLSIDGGGVFIAAPNFFTFDGTTKVVGNSFFGNPGDQIIIDESQTVVGERFTVTIVMTAQDAAGNLTTWAAPGTTFDNDADPSTPEVPFDFPLLNIGEGNPLDVNTSGGTFEFDGAASGPFVITTAGTTFPIDDPFGTGPSGAFFELVGFNGNPNTSEPDITGPLVSLNNETFAGIGFTFVYSITAPVPGEQGLIINGSFEEGDFGGNPSFRRLAPGDTELTGWTIGGVAVDWHNAVEFNFPNSGDRVLDLHLDGGAGQVGTISQSFATDVGERYILEFFLSGPGSNFGFPDPRSVNVDVAGVQQTFSAPASLNSDLQWSRQQLVFNAVDSTTTLTFSSPLNGIGFWGPVLDDVSVVLAPEVILGNVNLDGEVGLSDVPPFIDILKAGTFLEEADVNQDGFVNFSDIPAFVAVLSSQ